jgi:murein DD-endopeptidase MepM/ murein hydrolase activator NlpD
LAEFGWTRLAHLLFALTILLALAHLGSPSADPRPLDRATVEENPPAAEAGVRSLAPSARREAAVPAALADRAGGNDENGASAGAPDAADPQDPPVFYRPAPANPTPGRGGGVGPVCANLGTFASDRALAFPLPKEYLGSYTDTWGAPRPQGGHEGTDLMAPTGTPEYAITDGTIVPVSGSNENGWNTLGGYAVMLEADYSIGPVKKGDLFYYAHLERESALEIGTRVRVGQTVGYAGDTGQGPEVTRGLFPPHLHFGWYDARSTTRSTTTSGAMNPYPLLEWIKAAGGAITGGSDARYCEAPRTGGPIPSTGADRWPAPDSPGVSPDLRTGRQIYHAGGAVTKQQRVPAPKTTPQAATPSAGRPPPSKAPNPPAPPPGNGAPGDESPNPSDPEKKADPGGDEANDPPDEDKEDPGEEPGKDEAGEDTTDEQTSPGEDQYAPQSGRESDPEAVAR